MYGKNGSVYCIRNHVKGLMYGKNGSVYCIRNHVKGLMYGKMVQFIVSGIMLKD